MSPFSRRPFVPSAKSQYPSFMDKTKWHEYRTSTRQELKALLAVPLPHGARSKAWTPREVLHHVLRTEVSTLTLFERFVARADGAKFRKPSQPWTIREELFSFSLDRAMSVPPFRNTEPDPAVTDTELESLAASSSSRFQEYAGIGDTLDLAHLDYPHPLAGKLNYYEWLVFTPVHEWLHLRRLKSDLFPNRSVI